MTVVSRISLTLVLGLGIFAAIAGIMRQASMAATFTDSEPWVHDTYAIWNFIELDMGIIAASLPATKPMLNQTYKSAKTLIRSNKTSGCASNKTVYIRQGHRLIGARPCQDEAIGKQSCCNDAKAESTGGSLLPTSYSLGKGKILVTVTKHVEISKIV